MFALTGQLVASIAQSPLERELDVRVPKHIPLRIRISPDKEKAFKDLKNERWTDDFELEVKNTGEKPIFFLSLVLTLPEVTMPDGNIYGFSLNYGRMDFFEPGTSVKPEDTSIKPGETHVFTIKKHTAKGWEKYTRLEQLMDPTKVQIDFYRLSFADGTGFRWFNGEAIK